MNLLIASFCLIISGAATYASGDVGRICGQIYSSNGNPLTGAQIEVIGDNGTQSRTSTDANGNYAVESLSAGEYKMVVYLKGFARVEKCLRLRDGQEMNLDIGLQVNIDFDNTPLKINGEVRRITGSPLGGVIVKVLSPFGQELVAQGKTDLKGKYELSVLLGGQYIITAYKPGFLANAKALVVYEGKRLNFVLRPFRLR
jgi:large repetitive protein